MLDAFAFAAGTFDGNAGAGRGEDVEAVGGTDLVNAEEVGGITDDDNALEIVGAGNDGEAADRLSVLVLSVSAMMSESGTPAPTRYCCPTAAFGVLVTAVATQSDDERGDAATVEGFSVVEAGTENR